ncbi:hypothetical protein Cch01nite_13360 [Cellulomonas chitinilytica]|uniref:Histidine phosphatase family protein n=1 Tax=Cellulomonas chitinilytica TaxID=398759 RepID=A0A919P1V6_9CELL|nr:histidine phosphatase family protein [Cellulomonas chitinilytica]GIG20612.1 hypothetical protein Cch01nite_13360 [Cellulomonas chitinilytica]
MTRFVFVRHAESVHNRDGVISTATPGPDLTPEGVRQSEELAERLAGSLDAVYASPTLRATRTAAALARRSGAPLVPLDDLRELFAGVVEGTPASEGLPRLDAGWERWMADGALDEPVAPGGESATQVIGRLRRVVARVQQEHPGDAVVAVVAHGGILQLAVPAVCANLPRDHGRVHWLRNVEVVEAHGDGPDLTCDRWAGAPVPPGAVGPDARAAAPVATPVAAP